MTSRNLDRKARLTAAKSSKARLREPDLIIVLILVSVIGSIIGMQLVSQLGISANTSMIGVLFAIIVSRIPLTMFAKYRSVHRQNLIQTTISSSTFAAANCLLLTMGIPFAFGRPDLVLPMLLGSAIAMVIDALMLYWLFDSRIFPASGTWAPGIAAAETIIAGDRGGKRAGILGLGAGVGVVGSLLGIPMSAAGVALIGNFWALLMFAVGLLVAANSPALFGFVMSDMYIAHGFMVGAGVAALAQAIFLIVRNRKTGHPRRGGLDSQASPEGISMRSHDTREIETADAAPTGQRPAIVAAVKAEAAPGPVEYTRTERQALRSLTRGFVLYLAGATVLALVGGLLTAMPVWQIVVFVLLAAASCIAAEFIVGLSAMHAGWFPAFATALVFLVIALLLGMPAEAVVLLAGFVAAGSPAFADAGYDFKTGWVLRGRGTDVVAELAARRQQLFAGLIGFAVAAVIVLIAHRMYFDQGMIAPSAEALAAAIQAGLSPDAAGQLALWAVPGALVQLLGGSKRQMGVLLATGLLIASPLAGLAVLVALALRLVVLKWKGEAATTTLSIFGGGLIAGDAIASFTTSMLKLK